MAEGPTPREEGGLRVGFVRMGPHPIPNRLLPPELAEALGGASVETLDLERRVRRDPISLLVNPFFVAWEHGWNLLRRRIRPWRAFFTTTFMFRRMSAIARRWVERGAFDASFQIQSLYDARTPGTPHFVYTDHTHLANLTYADFDRRLLRGRRWIDLERRLYHGATLVFTRSGNISESLVRQYGCAPERTPCVGAGSNARTGTSTGTDSGREGSPHIVFVGADWVRKGGADLVEAFRRLREAHPELRLSIVGCRPGIDVPGIRTLGPRPLETVHRCYEAASIFCLPTRLEPFGVAILEAMHHGLPVVSTRVGAVPELVEDGATGHLVDPGDVDALTDRIGRLLADPAGARAMGERARRRARERFTWPAVAARMAGSMAPRLRGRVARGGEASSPSPRPGDGPVSRERGRAGPPAARAVLETTRSEHAR